MLIEKSITKGDVVSFKLASGEEVVAKPPSIVVFRLKKTTNPDWQHSNFQCVLSISCLFVFQTEELSPDMILLKT